MGACPCFSFLPCLGGHTVSDSKCCTKQVILIRHGESLWNQMLGHGHKARLAAAGHEKRHVESRENFKRNVTRLLKPQDEDSQARLEQRIDRLGGFLRGVRGGFRKARTIAKGAKDIHRVDHGLSRTGIEQARLLGQQIHALTRTGVRRFQRSNAETALVECRHWYVSPFLRAMQTAAFALAPLCDRGKGVKIDVDPLAREIMGSKASYDCRGKEGNVGYRVILRTLRKFGEAFSEEEEEAAAAAAAAGAAAADEQACDTRARAPLAIQPTRVVDVQLAYSTPERRLGMAKMLARLPEESIAGLPAKNSIDFNSAHSQNRRALALPLNADFAAYAVDDIHRLDAVLRHQRPAGGSYSQAQSQTASLLALLLRNPASVASAKLKQYAGNLNRKWGIERLLVAVRVKRHLGCCSRVLESADAESLRAQFAKLEEEVDQILLDETVQIPEDLAFGPPLGEAEEKGAEEEAPEEEEASAKKLKRAAKRRKKMAH
eukprot:TRINITY_DN16356_c0_g2_i3.p1 TRINITY_DN16356_c0_g2~~TRINITY_DN16356_c0_g2_i3.p1  ORF type:complete len:490 (+),score=94.95 TRINITY_DN16356_c0_g2_i3:62-1531(+)